ncbi:MAG: MBL fold metallo-hydrolase [Desulfuromonadales bacterium]|nr:MBL fold metallo-hydrolase [Desulfuromonadales bacterium]
MEQLLCIDLDQPGLTGFRKFISSWLYRSDDATLLVDPGPLSTIPHLVSELRRAGIKQLDAILLTHIHIDHAGGVGELLKSFPSAQVICHPEGVRHMVAPEKLWQGSLKVLGATAEAYGEILPVPAEQIGFSEKIGKVQAFKTPGHAQHHLSYLIGDLLFAGEGAGVRCSVGQGIYMRPATPPRFVKQVALDSIDKMLALQPKRMVFAHYGMVEDAVEHLKIAQQQLTLWLQGVKEVSELEPAAQEKAFYRWLLANDRVFANIKQLEPDLFERERIFLNNSLRGMLEYIASTNES